MLLSTYHHEGWSKEDPANEPIVAHFVANHLLNAAIEPLCPKYPADGDCLEKDAPKQRHAAGRVEVHQLEHIDTVPGDHGQAQDEHEHGHGQGELLAVRLQGLRPVVHQSCHQRLHSTELRVNAQGEQHDEEEKGPERRWSNGEDDLWVHEEGQAWTTLDHVLDLNTLAGGHVAQNGENDNSREEGSKGVDTADKDGVFVTVVVELVVAS